MVPFARATVCLAYSSVLLFGAACKTANEQQSESLSVEIASEDNSKEFIAPTRNGADVCWRRCEITEIGTMPTDSSNTEQEIGRQVSSCETLGVSSLNEFKSAPAGIDQGEWDQFAATALSGTDVVELSDQSGRPYELARLATSRMTKDNYQNRCEKYQGPPPEGSTSGGFELASGNKHLAFASRWPAPNYEYYYVHLYLDVWDGESWNGTYYFKILPHFSPVYVETYRDVGGRRIKGEPAPIWGSYWCGKWYKYKRSRNPDVSSSCFNFSQGTTIQGNRANIRLGVGHD